MRGRLVFLILTATALCCLLGCGKRETTITTPEGDRATVQTDRSGEKTTVTVETDEGEKGTVEIEKTGDGTKMTMESEEGGTKVEIAEDADISDLGVDIYPGAKVKSGGTVTAEQAGAEQMRTVILTTPDSYEDVTKYYRDKYSEGAQAVMEQAGTLIIIREQDGNSVHIGVNRDDDAGETIISITIMPKSG